MNLSRIFLTVLILIVTAKLGAAQETPRAVMIGKIDDCCIPDRIRGRIINFLQEINSAPGSRGLAIIGSEENLSPTSFFFFNEITGRAEYHRFDAARLTVIRAKRPGEVSVEFWKVPTGADTSSLIANQWPFEVSNFDKPYELGNTFREDGFSLSYELCANFLLANPRLRGKIIVYDKTLKAKRKEANVWLKALSEQYKVPRKQLIVSYRPAKPFNNGSNQKYSDVEFWLVPPRKK
jgi:hypothetical protein